MMYQLVGKKRKYSVLSLENRDIFLTKWQDAEFQEWLRNRTIIVRKEAVIQEIGQLKGDIV